MSRLTSRRDMIEQLLNMRHLSYTGVTTGVTFLVFLLGDPFRYIFKTYKRTVETLVILYVYTSSPVLAVYR